MNAVVTQSLGLINSSISAEPNLSPQSGLAVTLIRVTDTVWLTMPPVLVVLGCFGNVMTIVVMRALRASNSTACLSVYFTALALSDICILTTSMLFRWSEKALDIHVVLLHDATCVTLMFVEYVSSMTSAWLLMTMTGQRMISVILPHRVEVLCTVKRAKLITAALLTIACLVCTQVLFNYRVYSMDDGSKLCLYVDQNAGYIFYILFLVIASIIPFLFLVIANCVLIRGVLQSVKLSRVLLRRVDGHQPTSSPSAKVSSMTVTLILTSVAFLVLSIPICVSEIYLENTGFYEGAIQDELVKEKLLLFQAIATLLWISNSAVNFYLYILSGSKFRQEVKRYLCLPCQYSNVDTSEL